MVNNPSNVTLVAGPSHVVRWSWHVRDGVVDSPLEWDRFIGRGGAPIWHASLLRQAVEAAGAEASVVVLVGDFRFGNGILLANPVPSGVLVDEFMGVTAGAMTPEHDQAMLQRGLAGLRAWHETYGDQARYVLWDVFGRQVQDRLAGRHIADGHYRHPVFNYDEIAAALPGLDIVDLAPLLRLPQHDVSRLFIDGSNHPSQIGYLLLNGLVFDRLEVREAYDRAVATVEELLTLAQKISESAGRPVLLTGRSAWLDTLSRYMGVNGARRLADAGLILAPLDHVPGQPSLTQVVERTDLEPCAAVVVSAGGKDISALLARAFRTELSMWTDVPVIDWESATEKAIGDRGETPRFARLDPALPADPDAIKPALVSRAVEQGPLGTPSWSGLTALLRQIAGSRWHAPMTGHREAVMTAAQPDLAEAMAVNGSRARECYDAAPFLSLKHTTYFSVYDQLFSRFVGKAPVIVEVGVLNGGSLYMWREFFGADARIIGVDLNPEAVWLREDGFEIHIGDQSDPQFWENFFRQVGDVDIFLDDGGHTYPQQIVTSASALDHIRDGGLMVVEDTHTSYMSEFGGPSDTSFVSWAVNLVHGVNHRFSAFVEDHDPELRVWSVQFFESIVAFHVDRPLATLESQSTMNDGIGRDAKDFRYHSENTMTNEGLRDYFRH